MEKQQIGSNFFIPMPVVLVGTQVKGRANFMTVGWCARAIKDTQPDFPAIDPLFLTMPDNRYWTLGKYAGDAWSAGKSLIQR
jgi:hypothetical protein